MTNTQATYKILDSLPEGEYDGLTLTKLVHAKLENKKPYTESILRACRAYAEISGAEFTCIDRQKSLYKYVPSVKIEGAIID